MKNNRFALMCLGMAMISVGSGAFGSKNETSLPFFEVSDLTPYWRSNLANSENHQKPATLTKFEVLDQDRNTVTEKSFEGHVSVVNFFFAQCASTCPLMMSAVQKFQREIKQISIDKTLRIYSFSTNPDLDTPVVLKKYALNRKFDLTNWKLLTGEPKVISELGRGVFKADRSADGLSRDSVFIHSDNLFLIDTQKRIRGVYQAGEISQMALLKKDIIRLTSQLHASQSKVVQY